MNEILKRVSDIGITPVIAFNSVDEVGGFAIHLVQK